MRKVRALLVDDEPIANEGLAAMLRRCSDVQVIGECRDAPAAIDEIRRLAPDVVFLDVQMPGSDGFGVVGAFETEMSPIIIFVTAHDEYALRAFDVDAVDYLLKPVSDGRLDRAVERIRRQLAVGRSDDPSAAFASNVADVEPIESGFPAAAPTIPQQPDGARDESYLSRLTVRSGRRSMAIPVHDIDWIAADDYCVNLVVHGRRHLLRASLASLELRLDPSMFIRVHRSALVNVSRVKEWHTTPLRRLVLVLSDDTRLRVSRSRRASLLARLSDDSGAPVAG
ncbi:MAG: response regulator [Gemmatimonadaceae bacterium]